MAIENEDLLALLQRASAITKRSHHSQRVKKPDEDSGRHGQNRILACLVMQDGMSQKDLAFLLGIRPQTLSEAIDNLERSGCAQRRHNDADKRVVNVFLTEQGRIRASKVARDRRCAATDVLSVLCEEEKEQLAAILGKIVEANRPRDEQAG